MAYGIINLSSILKSPINSQIRIDRAVHTALIDNTIGELIFSFISEIYAKVDT